MEQQIRFCTTSDGVTIAYATIGEGPALVYVAGWPGHLELEWETEFSREFLTRLSRGIRLIRYDMRGSGLSDRDASDLSLAGHVRDLAGVVQDLNLDRVNLLSLGFLAGPIAMTYAAQFPDRVASVILCSGYLRGQQLTSPERGRAIVESIRTSGVTSDLSEITEENLRQFRGVADIRRASASREVQAKVTEVMLSADVSDLAPRLSMPILVLHGRQDNVIAFRHGRDLAARIPRAKFVPFEGESSSPWQHTAVIVKEIRGFLGIDADEPGIVVGDVHTILFTDIASSTATTRRLGDAKAQELVRAHNAIVREALAAHGGSEIKHTGDGIMASFPTASGALECAVAIQRAVDAANDPNLQVHVGLNAGEPVAEESDLFGTSVQLARRICDHAEAGQVLASNVVRELAAGKGFLFADIGEVVPKGFEEPVRLYEVRWRA